MHLFSKAFSVLTCIFFMICYPWNTWFVCLCYTPVYLGSHLETGPCFRWQPWIGSKIYEASALLSIIQSVTTTGHSWSFMSALVDLQEAVCLSTRMCILVEEIIFVLWQWKGVGNICEVEVGTVSKKREGDCLWLHFLISLDCLVDPVWLQESS